MGSDVCSFSRLDFRRRSSRFGGKDDEVSFGYVEFDEFVGYLNRGVWSEFKKDVWEILVYRW